ncbi:MAG: ECF transporter S component [Oscillibacter sp.]|jgi:uncharacterized membrane protein|nr:ECF transporter S component [Oscillibacter sp.]
MENTLLKSAAAPRNKVQAIVMTALFAALACVATLVIHLPSPTGGYLNLGDTVVLLGAYLLGPWYGAVAGGVGSALADLISGYAAYAPATLLIKAMMAIVAGLVWRAVREKQGGTLLAGVLGEIPMVVGYWLYDALLLRSLIGGAAGIPANLVQAAVGIAASALLALSLRKSAYVRRKFPLL